MRGYIFSCLFLVSLLMVPDGGAQIPADNDNPIWTMEIIKVKPGKFGPTLSYLDDIWMRFREDAKRQGAVLSYHRIAEEDSTESNKNQAAYDGREKLLDSFVKRLP